MSKNRIGVGVIGASTAPSSWAARAHMPAIEVLDRYELRAVGTSRPETAAAAAAAFGAPAGYHDHRELLADETIDLVVVAVKVTHHRELVVAALEAGKAVFCEWPLTPTLAEAEDLARLAEENGSCTAVGLQGRYVDEIRYLRDLVAEGYVGEILSSSIVSSAVGWGPVTDSAHKYTYDRASGASVLTVTGFHALDPIATVLGEYEEAFAHTATRRSEVFVADEEVTIPATEIDQVALTARLEGGSVFSAVFRSGTSRGQDLRWEINGTEGDLVVTAEGNGNLQNAPLTISGGHGDDSVVGPLALPTAYAEGVPESLGGPARQMARLYSELATDIDTGSTTVPDFSHAVRRHRMIEALTAEGWRQT